MMVFLYPQTQHPLIPQAHSPEENLALARETKNFRNEFFPLLQNKIEAISANNSESNDSELVYRHIRQKLDATPEIQAANQRRSILQDRLWERVAIDIKSECDRLSKEFESYLKIRLKIKKD